MHTFCFPLRHLEQKHTHLHIDFVNALFIYLFPLSCVGVTVIIIHSSAHNAKSKSMIFLFTAKNHVIQSHDKIYSHYFIVFGLMGRKLYHVLVDCQLSMRCRMYWLVLFYVFRSESFIIRLSRIDREKKYSGYFDIHLFVISPQQYCYNIC